MSKLSLFLLLTLFVACQKDEYAFVNQPESLVFGSFYSECAGDCTVYYQLTPSEIFADSCDYCYFPAFQPDALPQEKFKIAESLLDSVPLEFLKYTEHTIACPDCTDGGGYFMELQYNGKIYTWRFPAGVENQDDYLGLYARRMLDTMRKLQ